MGGEKEYYHKNYLTLFLRLLLLIGIGGIPQEGTAGAQDALSAHYALIGTVGGNDQITLVHIDSLLLRHGIEVVIEGSLAYGISVPRKQAEQAKRLLREDVGKQRYWIWIGEKHFDVPVKVWRDYQINQEVLRLKSRADPRIPKQVLVVLRDPSLQKYRYLTRLHLRQRHYLPPHGSVRTGYEGEVELRASAFPGAAGIRQSFQVYDEGRCVSLYQSVAWER